MAVYYWGSGGNIVARIQHRLKDLGYFSDNIDGIFGSNTYNAVVSFQASNGLEPDGIVGDATLEKLGITLDVNYENDLYTLAAVDRKSVV